MLSLLKIKHASLSRILPRTLATPSKLVSLPSRIRHHGDQARVLEGGSSVRSVHTQPAYEGHIPLTWFENAFLAVGSAIMSLVDPRRGGEKASVLFFRMVLIPSTNRYDRCPRGDESWP